jgi:hypothetical protein
MTITFTNGHITLANIKTKTAGLTLHKTLKTLIKQKKDFTLSFNPTLEDSYQEYVTTN